MKNCNKIKPVSKTMGSFKFNNTRLNEIFNIKVNPNKKIEDHETIKKNQNLQNNQQDSIIHIN